jgi:hypothetical protein
VVIIEVVFRIVILPPRSMSSNDHVWIIVDGTMAIESPISSPGLVAAAVAAGMSLGDVFLNRP